MRKLSAVFVSIMILSAVAQGGVYVICDVEKSQRFWIDTDYASSYGNQLILWAIVTDDDGNYVTGNAMVLYDMCWGNVNLIDFDASCTFTPHWDFDYDDDALMANLGSFPRDGRTWWCEDSIFLVGREICFNKKVPQSKNKQDVLNRNNGTGSGEGSAVATTEVFGARDTSASTAKTPYLEPVPEWDKAGK